MTDARLPHRWLGDPTFDALSDRVWRVHTSALMWSNEHGTDGRIPRRTLRILHPDGATPADAAELVARGLWEVTGDGWQIRDWADTQSTAADIQRGRELSRERQKRWRERQAQPSKPSRGAVAVGVDASPPPSNVTPLSREHVNAPSAGWTPGDRDRFHSWVEHDQALVCDLQLILTGEHTRPDDWIISNLEGNVTRFTELVRSMPREELEAVDCRALRTVAAGEVVRQALDHTQAERGPAGPSTDDPTPQEQDPHEPWGAPWGTISTRPVPVDNPKGTTT